MIPTKARGPAKQIYRAQIKDAQIQVNMNVLHTIVEGKQFDQMLTPDNVVRLAREMLGQLTLGKLSEIDIHDLKHIQRTVAMLIAGKEAPL